MSNFVDLTGQKFGYLTVIEHAYNYKGRAHWKCKCDCGKDNIVTTCDLKSGHTKSCGCKKFETHNSTHKQTKTRLYSIWSTMKKRCNNPKDQNYKRYGGRGIHVCDEWQNDFMMFYHWSKANGYADNLTIDRIDNDGNYCPENCRWVSSKVQNNNRTTNIYIEHNGETKTLSEWCEALNFRYKVAQLRYCRKMAKTGAVTFDDIFSLPYNYRSRRISQFTKSGELVKIWNNFAEIDKSGLFNRCGVVNCCIGKSKSSGGYIWRYTEA